MVRIVYDIVFRPVLCTSQWIGVGESERDLPGGQSCNHEAYINRQLAGLLQIHIFMQYRVVKPIYMPQEQKPVRSGIFQLVGFELHP